MNTLSVASAALTLLVAASLAPAIAQGPKLSDDNVWPGISQRVDSGSPNAVTTTPHYEHQYRPTIIQGDETIGFSFGNP